MTDRSDQRKLLVLGGPALEAQGVVGFLSQHFDVHLTSEMDEALSAMRNDRYAAVLSETADFLPLERGVVTQQAAAVLDTLGDGVCIVGPTGELVWANRRLRGFCSELFDSLREICAKAFCQFEAAESLENCRGKRFTILPDDRTYLEVICSPVCDSNGQVRQVAAVVVNATVQRRQQLKLNAIDRAGRELVHLESASIASLDASERLRLLEERIISCSREVLNYQHFAVLLLDKRSNRLEITISEGLSEEAKNYEYFARAEDNGICGYVASTGRSYICPDVSRDQRYLPGMPGAQSCLSVPLQLHDKIIGVLHVESDKLGVFGEEDRQFAEIFAHYVAMALHILNLLVAERHTTHTQVSGSMAAELAGPINDIISEATELKEDYIGMDDLRKRLDVLVDLACRARRSIQAWGDSASGGVLGLAEPVNRDPLLCGKRVLVVDDEELIRNTVRDVLIPCGAYVDIASDGKQAKDLICQNCYDLVISDIKMPQANGYEVFAAAKEKQQSTEVILMTAFGYDPNHSIVKANREGLSSVLFKPFKVNQLLEECRSALGNDDC